MPSAELDIPKSWLAHMNPNHANRLRTWFPIIRSMDRNPYHSIVDGREKVNPIVFAKDFRKATHFKEIDEDLITTDYPYDVTKRLPDGNLEYYPNRLVEERKRGRNEAVSYGIGSIGKRNFVGLIFNWEFMLATSGVVVGEKFLRAMDLATDENLPVVILYCSGGQRQQEAAAALRVMTTTRYAISQFKKKTNQPIISVLVGDVWGGISASAVTAGDLVIGMAGTDFGFAGPSVIEAVTRKRPPQGSQTVENSFRTNRNVHMILNTQEELLNVLDKTLAITDETEVSAQKPKKVRQTSGIDFEGYGYKTPLESTKLQGEQRTKIKIPINYNRPQTAHEQHQLLRADPRYPDTLYILRHGFDGFVPLFSGRITIDLAGSNGSERWQRHLRYPAIVAALAYIDDPRLSKRLRMMVIGNQPSYIQLTNGTVYKDHAGPTAWDFRYQISMLEYAQRLRLGVTSFVDTFGAASTIEDELVGQYKAIDECLKASVKYPYFTRGYIIGVSGSGGGLATLFTADYVAQMPYGQEFVAEPKSATAILQKDPNPEDERRITEGMKPSADHSLSLGLIDKVIPEPQKGANNDPLSAVLALREDIILTELEYGGLTTDEISQRRDQRIRNLHSIPVGHLHGRSRRRFPFRLLGH